MDENLNTVIEQIARDKGFRPEILTEALQEAILAAAKRAFGNDRNLQAEFNPEKGAVDLMQAITVVENVEDVFNEISTAECEERDIEVDVGDEMVFPIYYLAEDEAAAQEQDEEYGDILKLKTYRRSFGRIAAQTAKQVIIQRIRDAERGLVFGEYKDRKDELVTGVVRRFERGSIIIDLGRAEAILPMRYQCPRESYRVGDRVQAYVHEVQEHARGPQIVLSRTAPQLLIKLFEMEVPEISEGIVKIESAAREPGSRAKIAVSSRDRDVDPVGACVGMKGSRVQAVVQELRGEKIDIVPFSSDPATFVCNALQPAEVSRVLIDEGNHTMEIIVPDDQLSLAIGRKGQNVRLASELAGWRIDIHSESRIDDIKDRAWLSLNKISGMNEFLLQNLYNHGIRSAKQLSEMDREFLMQFPGIEEENYQTMMDSAREVAVQESEQEEIDRAETERAGRASEAVRDFDALINLPDDERLRLVRGVSEPIFKQLMEGNVTTVERMAELSVAELVEASKVSEQKAKLLVYNAKQRLKLETEIRDEAEKLEVVLKDGRAYLPGQVPSDEPAETEESASSEEPATNEDTESSEDDGAEMAAS